LSFIVAKAYSQTGSITGVVTDSLTGQPVVNLSVFIPSTTSGTTTNQKGEYRLDQLNPGDYILMFRHLSYPPYSRSISIEPGKQVVLNLQIAEQTKKLKEVVIVGKAPDRRLGYYLFKKYFIGDEQEKSCVLENPQDLSFNYDGDTLKVSSKQPLKIINRHLGYRITYFLDYFKYVDIGNHEFSFGENGCFGYAGNALFEDLASTLSLNAIGWKVNRNGEFKGSLRHFLACLYRNELKSNHYYLRRAYRGLNDLQIIEKQSHAMTRIRFAQMDSLFTWHAVSGKSEILYYYPDEEYVFNDIRVDDKPGHGTKSLSSDAFLLVFSDFKRTKDLRDDCISTLSIPKEGIIFDQDGNYWIHQGELAWISLDNTLQVKRLLPFDYMPKLRASRDSL
jgi:hypothetical protein